MCEGNAHNAAAVLKNFTSSYIFDDRYHHSSSSSSSSESTSESCVESFTESSSSTTESSSEALWRSDILQEAVVNAAAPV